MNAICWEKSNLVQTLYEGVNFEEYFHLKFNVLLQALCYMRSCVVMRSSKKKMAVIYRLAEISFIVTV